MFLKTE